MAAPQFTFVTCNSLPDLDPDDRLAKCELERRGYSCRALTWDDREADWSASGTAIIRSTWDYHLKHSEFVRWAESVSRLVPLWNPLALVKWNSEKTYLRDLEAGGAPIVPTVWIERNSQADLAHILDSRRWPTAVIKPAVGLATYGVKKIARAQCGDPSTLAHLQKLAAEGPVMVQPYLSSVETHGERALVFIGGEFSHAVRKRAFQQLAVAGQAGESPVAVADDELEIARRALQSLPLAPLYARVDMIRSEDDKPLIIELELVEPSLFLAMCNEAAARLADALERLL